MHVSKAIVDSLLTNGIDTVFGIPGTQTLPINEHLDRRDDIRYLVGRHETALPYMAWGYTNTTGRLSATLTIPGPGDLNASNGLRNALNDYTPIVHLSIDTEPELRGTDAIHETPSETYDTIVKENVQVETPESAAAELERAIAVAETPPTGPVRVGIPKNFLRKDVTMAEPDSYDRSVVEEPDPNSVADGVAVIADAEQPIILAGNGVRRAEATEELRTVAERLGAPVATTYRGKGVFPEDHELFVGVVCGGASHELVESFGNADAALAIGTDFDPVTTRRWALDLPEKLVHITLDPDDIGTGYEPRVAIVADAADALVAFEKQLAERAVTPRDGARLAERVREAATDRVADAVATDTAPFTSVAVLSVLRGALPNDTIVVGDSGGFRLWAAVDFEAYESRRYVHTGSWASMGSGLPGAVGAKVANPETPVVSLVGDGGLMMALPELHTAVVEEVPIIVVVANNRDYATISAEAGREYALEYGAYGWEKAPIDFKRVAEGMGMNSVFVETLDALESATLDALNADIPTLIEVPTDPNETQANAVDW
jgi:acetolactate synthase-1/2/3 large subunit